VISLKRCYFFVAEVGCGAVPRMSDSVMRQSIFAGVFYVVGQEVKLLVFEFVFLLNASCLQFFYSRIIFI